MPLQTALFTGLSGLAASSRAIDVTGNNIANVNTTAFKKSRISFETTVQQTLKSGSAPNAETGGTNPAQVGMGVRLASIQRDFSSGGFNTTGVATDASIEGNGWFILDDAGSQRYTRNGNFSLDRDFNLTSSGAFVQGYGVDENFNVVDGQLENINIPLGVLTIAEQTNEVNFAGNLNAGGEVGTLGSIINSETLYSDAAATTQATAGTALNSLFDASGNQIFTDGDLVSLNGATKGGAVLPEKTFEITTDTQGADDTGTTVQDMLDFFDDVFGIDESLAPGVQFSAGQFVIEGNVGEDNDIDFEDANLIVNPDTAPTAPIEFNKTQDADGESVRTQFVAYDSLGNPLNIDMTFVLENKDDTGTQWRFYAQSDDDSDLDRQVSTGLINFDTDGKLISTIDGSITIDRNDTGAFTPQQIDLGFEDQFGSVSALYDVRSQVSAVNQDGSQIGTLEDFNIAENGTITGVFSNGLLRTLGQIPLAMFANNAGLTEVGGSQFRAGVNSGIATIVNATTGGSGKIIGRSLELSNVELSEEFINLISAQTGYSANSRIISTSDQLIQELLATVR